VKQRPGASLAIASLLASGFVAPTLAESPPPQEQYKTLSELQPEQYGTDLSKGRHIGFK
jgi:hypothetical protein